jgi:hypothetical protein
MPLAVLSLLRQQVFDSQHKSKQKALPMAELFALVTLEGSIYK